ncbi:MAG: monovalent cation/H+ antiporter complex subunit F [Planctomycetota bacterium]
MLDVLYFVLDAAIVVHLVLIAICLWRLWHGQNAIDRLIALDVVGTLVIALIVLMAIRQGWTMWLDLALGFAAVGFAGTVVLAKLVAERVGDDQTLGGTPLPEDAIDGSGGAS